MLLKHFNQILPSDIGGHDQCCDNCRRKLVLCIMKVVMFAHNTRIITIELDEML